ncbi:hypothetical protein [Patulibacter minatonensis]|uniref:hypothetical protein n=1 Tax=Patulibacter minatonensis TaxID=298163 RepID=UPI0004B60872|nr:hypothetical protein [Patulibacter minatonensis]
MVVIALLLVLWLVLNVGVILTAALRSDDPPAERRPMVGELRVVRGDDARTVRF